MFLNLFVNSFVFDMKVFILLFVLISFASACLGGGNQCCAPSQPSCGNPCGGGIAPAAIGPAPYASNAYAVAGK
uniref:Uncharacterized protein n=1 Tax=Caenorhabditis tropicalis TaxID=1561998 RepID=A0A1I7TK52_9PELO